MKKIWPGGWERNLRRQRSAGLSEIRNRLEEKGYETILADNGDAVQGDVLGVMTNGEAIIELMNSAGYDIAVPGNHEFDYTADKFLELTKKADFPYICCNLSKNGEPVFDPYVIKEAGGMKIAFVGVDTPQTITSSTPSYFQDESGRIVYDFREGGNGQELYDAVQAAVDSARAEGADYVYVLGHPGMDSASSPWTYADVISHTSGIDVFLDGHSHDTEQVVMNNKDSRPVVRSACGTKMQAIGYSELSREEGIKDTGIWTWNNDPVEKDSGGKPLRVVRFAETNMGDFCADAARIQLGADIGIVNSGNVRADLKKGDITYGDILEIYPFCKDKCIVEATGQQILDALEWGARSIPSESGAFLQVSGLTYEVDVNTPSPCTKDDEGMFTGVSGTRRVRNVKVGGKVIDPSAKYTVSGSVYVLTEHGDGCTMFDGATLINTGCGLDYMSLIDYIKEPLGGVIGDQYSDPYGEGRIKIIQ